MVQITNVSRRKVLKGGALTLAVSLYAAPLSKSLADSTAAGEDADQQAFTPAVYLSIDATGLVTIIAHRSEMGQGIRTSLPMVVADELEADWNRVRIEQAPGDEATYGSQNTDGSRSVRRFFAAMREAGATARHLLEAAAARRWQVPARECAASQHRIVHVPTGNSVDFSEVAILARDLPAPRRTDLRFKDREEWTYIGKEMPIVDLGDITLGQAIYGIDVRRPGMVFAAIARPPVLGGKVVSFDDKKALEIKGVEAVIKMREASPPFAFQPLGGVAVVASNTFAAFKGKEALEIEWDDGTHASYSSSEFKETLTAAARVPGKMVRQRGNVFPAFEAAATRMEAEYYIPHHAHAPMEPQCAVAEFAEDGSLEVWAPTQHPQNARDTLAALLGMPVQMIKLNVTLLGGGFGRKSKPDFIVEAAWLARKLGKPVHVTWSREDDIRHDYLHTVSVQRLEAGLDEDGKTTGWRHRSVFPSIGSLFNPSQRTPADVELSLGLLDTPYNVPNLRLEAGEAEAHVRIGWFRSVANVQHAFAIQSFVDELAHEAGRDPKDYLLELIGDQDIINLNPELTVPHENYGEPVDKFPVDAGRLRNVVQRVAAMAEWGRVFPDGQALGIAAHRSFLSYVATVVHVDVQDGELRVPAVYSVIDAGIVVNPDRVKAQVEGAAVMGLSLAMGGEITAANGRVDQSNFHDFEVTRMREAPHVAVEIVESDELPAGVGEPGLPPFAPALCNAIFAATGRRIRHLPIRDQIAG